MPRMKDRMRLKDRILENVGKAIRLIQDFQSRDKLLVLTNSDWQFQKLVSHLDHAFLHGLRNVTNGYWILVQDFTHKSTVKDIQQLSNVTTDLGRGRAWLYKALNDRLLESYTRCYLDNKQFVKRYYVKEALALDEQRLQILMTLASGLEMIYFQLEVNVPYLDLVSCMKLKSSESEADDRSSVSSQDSSLSKGSYGIHDPFDESNVILPSRGQRSFSIDCVSHKNKRLQPSMSLPLFESDVTIADPKDNDRENAKIEVINLLSRNRKKRLATKRHESDPIIETVSVGEQSPNCDDRSVLSAVSTATVTPTTPESGYRSTVENPLSWQQDSVSEGGSLRDEGSVNLNNNSKDKCDDEIASVLNNKTQDEMAVSEQNSHNTMREAERHLPPVSVHVEKDLNWTQKELQLIQNLNDILIVHNNNSAECQILKSDQNNFTEKDGTKSGKNELSLCLEKDTSVSSDCENVRPGEGCRESKVLSSDIPLKKPEQSIYDDDDDDGYRNCVPDHIDTETQSPQDTSLHSPGSTSSQEKLSGLECLQLSAEEQKTKKPNGTKHSRGGSKLKKDHDAEVMVDNNLMLLLMLEVFEVEDEKLIKMYQTCIRHTEGAVVPIYVLLSDAALYLLTTQYGQKKFKKEGVVKHRELDYISLSMNFQIINIVCMNRRKQFWITTGDEELTRCIVSHLDLALRNSETCLEPLSVLTDATTQKIAIRKWLAAECKTEITNVNIIEYRLVNWEDLNNDEKPCIVSSTNKEGILYYKTEPGLFFSSYWKEAYFILKDGFLSQYADRHDNQPPKLTIQLNQEDCVGCRHCCLDDRQYCFEVILASGSTLQLSAVSEKESREWLQSLCKAISQGTGVPTVNIGVLPCCTVLTSTHIFLFHEDVETNFCRTLASGHLIDLVNVLIDPGAQIYLIMVFQSHTVKSYSRKWVLYFNTVPERDGFLSKLSKAWSSQFHSRLPRMAIKDTKLCTECRAVIGRLKKQRRV